MGYSVSNNVLHKDGKPVRTVPTSKKSGGKNTAKYIVIHYTAGVNFESDVKVLSSSPAQVSCQLVLSPTGEFVQVGSLTDIQWHAGKSTWDGISGLNSHSIGIEVTCPGWVELSHKDQNGVSYFKYPANGKVYWNSRDDNVVQAKHKNGGPVKYWVRFTEAQMEALREAVPVIKAHYKSIEVVGHDMIAPERKIDPGPCLPDGFYAYVNGRHSDEDDSDQVGASKYDYVVRGTANTGLNVRKWPDSSSAVIVTIPEGTKADRIREKGSWWLVETEKGVQGWVFSKFLSRI